MITMMESKAKMPPYHRAEVGMEARGQIDRNRSSVGKDPGRSPGGPGRHHNEDLHDYIMIIMIMITIKMIVHNNIKLSSVWLLIVTLKMTYSGAPVISIPSKILKSHLGKTHQNQEVTCFPQKKSKFTEFDDSLKSHFDNCSSLPRVLVAAGSQITRSEEIFLVIIFAIIRKKCIQRPS